MQMSTYIIHTSRQQKRDSLAQKQQVLIVLYEKYGAHYPKTTTVSFVAKPLEKNKEKAATKKLISTRFFTMRVFSFHAQGMRICCRAAHLVAFAFVFGRGNLRLKLL